MVDFVNITRVDVAVSSIPKELCFAIKTTATEYYSIPRNISLWGYTKNNPNFNIVRDEFIRSAKSLWERNSNLKISIGMRHAWFNDYSLDGGWNIAPHLHHDCIMNGTLYLEADDDPGDILIQDPLAHVGWINRLDKRCNGTGRVSIPITPKAGMIIVMPAFLVHSTELPYNNKRRCALSIDFYNETKMDIC
jgi:hypothetical protein